MRNEDFTISQGMTFRGIVWPGVLNSLMDRAAAVVEGRDFGPLHVRAG